jgi:GMP synthase-like glutamine amidotransferase
MRTHFIQHVSFETPGYLLEWAQQQQHNISFIETFNEIVFPTPGDIDLLIIMGGPMGVYEEERYPWLKQEKKFIKEVIEKGKKVLGICLGSQLIAEVLGARVYPNTEKEIGWWPVSTIKTTAVDKLLRDLPDEFVSFHWHGDTFDLPKGAIHLFTTPACPHQGYLIGNNIAALQFHPEATDVLINEMINHGKEELVQAPYIQPEKIMREETISRVVWNGRYMQSFINNFLAL